MGDLPPGSGPPTLDTIAAGLAQDDPHLSSASLRSPSSNPPFYSQLSSIPQTQLRPDLRSPAHPTSPHYPPQDHSATSLNMGAMTGALPDYASADGGQPQHAQRQLSGASTSALVYQLQQNLQMHGQASNQLPVQSGYGPSFGAGQFQQNYMPNQASAHTNYAPYPAGQQRGLGLNSMHSPYHQNYSQQPPYMYYPTPYGAQQFAPSFPGQGAPGQAMYGRRPSLTSPHPSLPGQAMDMSQQDAMFSPGHRAGPGPIPGDPGSMGWMPGGQFMQPPGVPRPGPVSSIPRGPPRKPKQSGHALWVGNLPPGTTVTALKDHFSRDATKDIESLFLISKSNCAFVNYRTEASCTAAMHRFHDSRFNGVRLVCRLRRSSAPASGVPTGPSAMVGSQAGSTSPPMSPREAVEDGEQTENEAPARKSGEDIRASSAASDKYFIVKSLTLQDLELSVRNGIWATQSHNEETLNKAFETADNVYLVFSANKSGEYFGYARMASRILEDDGQLMGSMPKPENILEATDVPKSIPTAATEFAPKGRIIDDSARGTIFWEAELSESEGEEEKEEPQVDEEAPVVAQSWGKPFRIEWISTNRLPFYRTRGLRNPWNANREVKIARDGTELEPGVGERLLQMFRGPSAASMMPPHPGGHMRSY
ncbi:hypothetical protein N0V90_003077 [Kalmusia sp. IMI 367209]|nr:hypothetical protein N0V90_003077 [Kalmusia sp. IMI 367209]